MNDEAKTEELGITPEQLAAHEKRQALRQQAAADPMPGPLLDAFLPDAASAAGMELQPVVAAHLTILKRLNSPLYRQILQMDKPKEERTEVEYQDEEVWELLYVFTRPVREVRAALARGRDSFREAAMEATADRLPFNALESVQMAVVAHFSAALTTIVAYRSAPTSDGTVFTMPPAAPATGSVGG